MDFVTMYPNAADAIILCEHLRRWDMFRLTAEVEGVASLKKRMRQSLLEAMKISDPARREVMQKALSQWDHPEFDNYLAAKLGMM